MLCLAVPCRAVRGFDPMPACPCPACTHVQWDRDAIAKAADEVKAQMADSTRTMIGQRQLSAVKQAVQESGRWLPR